MFLNKTIRLFLDSIGRREEYEFYLDKFRSVGTPAFGLLCPNLPAVEQAAEMIDFDLRFLQRLELHPVVLLAGPDAGAMRGLLAEEGDHWRVEDLDVLPPEGRAEQCGELIRAAARAGRVLLLTSRQTADEVLPGLVPALARRVHFLRARGPLRDEEGAPLPFYYTARSNERALAPEDGADFERGRRLLEARPGSHLSFTSPYNLLTEFFTVKGSGTVLRPGSRILYTTRREEVDPARLDALLRESFGRALAATGWLEAVRHFYIEQGYRGAALLEEHPRGVYLSKFAVGTEARGEGLAQELWHELAARHPAVFWRSRPANPVNQWYEKKAEGRFTASGWNVYWRGLQAGDVPGIVAYCVERPSDFAES